ncbi:uncharacterized protein HGUI_03209 [Hanseniaspora guilliermondii]|uniref:Manganese resistance protein MNR2 n=1 Tax=Hanseniaspora guilliermondii TaxID=56406 RepID=A0A1L0CR48_9ASCO|nr:uncharacterized protein HGUI_03209 [Hanseniaspora guilliermondii]
MIDSETLESSENPLQKDSSVNEGGNLSEQADNDISMVELPNISESKSRKITKKSKRGSSSDKKGNKKGNSSKTKKSSKSKKEQKKNKVIIEGENMLLDNNSEQTTDDVSDSSESSSESSSEDTSSTSTSSSSSSSSTASSSSSSSKKKSNKKNKFSIQQHPLYIRSFDDVNGTFIDHRPSMTEPVLKNKKKSMLKKRRERKKKAKAERQKEIAKQNDESNPSSMPNSKGESKGKIPLETVHEETEHVDENDNRDKLIADLQDHLNEDFSRKHVLNDQAKNYGSIINKGSETNKKDKYKGRSHFTRGYPPELSNTIDQQIEGSFDELRLTKKKSNDSNNDLGHLGSKPPSSNSNSSDASSLGDVCLPITSDSEYYISDINTDEENNESIGSCKSKSSEKSQSENESDKESATNSKGFDGTRYEEDIMNSIFEMNKTKNKYNKKNSEDEIHNHQGSKTTSTSSLRNKNKRRKKSSVKKEWPDISVLEEFSKDETEKLKKQALDNNRNIRKVMSPDLCYDNIHARGLNSHSPITMNQGYSAANQRLQTQEDTESNASSSVAGFQQTIGFKNPLVSNVDVPELGNAKINETELLKGKALKNNRFQAWKLKNKAQKKLQNASSSIVDRTASNASNLLGYDMPKLVKTPSNTTANLTRQNTDINENSNFLIGDSSVIQYPPQIISNNPEHFRFAYFRDDMESTVHSPTISGLLQPGQSFRDLFVGEHYKKNVDYDESDFDSEGNLKFDEDNNYVAPFWLDVLNPTEEEMKVISKSFGIHPLTAEDIFLGEAREKVELFKDYYLVCFRSFDIVAERHSRDNRSEKSGKSRRSSFSTISSTESVGKRGSKSHGIVENLKSKVMKFIGKNNSNKGNHSTSAMSMKSSKGNLNDCKNSHMSKQQKEKELDEYKRKSGSRHKPRSGELEPLNVYILVFRTGVLTFHFAPTPHPINVRRRARLIRDYMDVSSDWVAYALIDDITDSFAPIIEIIEDEVYDIEEAILKMHNPDIHNSDDDSDESDYSDFESNYEEKMMMKSENNMNKRNRSMSTVGDSNFMKNQANNVTFGNGMSDVSSMTDTSSMTGYSRGSSSSSSSDSASIDSNIILWKRKGDMLRRIAECRKRVMSVSRLLGSKADVIKSFAKRCNEDWEVAPRSDIGMYLGDIQDHIVTMVSSLNHFEKLLSRSHSNYLAQINIDMTKVNNDMNDVLGKITILGTAVLPLNVITGLWGMNCIVPGQYYDNLGWFFGIVGFMIIFTAWSVWYTKKKLSF